LNFRKKAKKDEVPIIPKVTPHEIYENKDYYEYIPNGFESEEMEDLYNFYDGELPHNSISLRKFQHYFQFHQELLFSIRNKINFDLIPIILLKHNPVGLHRDISKESPLENLKFFCLHKRVIIFCTNCKSYKLELELKNCPDKCPICGAKVLVPLYNTNDDVLFSEKNLSKDDEKKFEKYEKISSMFLYHGKHALYVVTSGIFGLRTSQYIVNGLDEENDDMFFEQFLKIKEYHMMKRKFLNVLYI
jgi:hypothetical protein